MSVWTLGTLRIFLYVIIYMKFSELPLSEAVNLGVKDAGFSECTDVQERTFAHTLQGRDVCVQSQTGTGKTAAYLLSVFQLMTEREDFKDHITVIIAPTRELAVQIDAEAKLLGRHVPLKVGCFYGGVGYVEQERSIADGVDIVIGTPGRLIDFSQSRKLDFGKTGIVIIDEADRLFDMGFYPDIRRILRKMPPREERVSMLFSATLSTRARNIAWEHMNNPAEVEINPEQVTVEGVTQVLYHVSREEKFRLLLGLLGKHNPETAIIFTNTKRAAEEVSRRLEMNGHESTFIMGDLPQRKRLRVIEGIKAGKVKLLVATDVAARGLHIEDLDMVFNYDIPEDRESYVHRIGRTARAGKKGVAISLADERFVYGLPAIEELLGYTIPVERVSDDLIAEDSSAGVRIALGRHAESSRGRPDRRGDRRGDGRDRSGDTRRPRSSQPRREAARPDAGGEIRRPAEAARSTRARTERGEGGRSRQGRKPRGPVQKPEHAPRVETAHAEQGGPARPDKRTPMEKRLEYYKQKYGEDFSVNETSRGGKGGQSRSEQARKRKPERVAGQNAPGAASSEPKQAPRPESAAPSAPKPSPQDEKGLFGKLRRLFGGDRK